MQYRPFLNSDPPAIAEIWRSQPSTRSLAQSATPATLDRLVFSKPYFDREGFIVADDGERAVGFAHAGFSGTEDGAGLNRERGVISLVLVAPHENEDDIAAQLLAIANRYLREAGANEVVIGGHPPLSAPFYMGLFGGCQPAGIPQSNPRMMRWVEAFSEQPLHEITVLSRSLAGFRPIVNRDQMQIRRKYRTEPQLDPSPETWWEACTTGFEHRTRYELCARSGPPSGHITYWDMEPIASSWGVHACGLLDIHIDEDLRRQGLGTYLVCESLRQMQSQGATLVECQADSTNEIAVAFLTKLGFEQVDRGVVFAAPPMA